jgi:glutamate dehydrogenase/leucine dehydrogenase
MHDVRIQKLETTDAFIVFDLDGAEHNIGVTRLAPKILVDGATLLARSTTYLLAVFEQQAGGASAGINAKPDARAGAVAAFVAEAEPLVAAGTFLTEPGRGLTPADVAPLVAVDPRVGFDPLAARELLGPGAATAAEMVGGLDGRRVAVEGLDVGSLSVLTALAARGARVNAIATSAGAVSDAAGLDVAATIAAVTDHGPAAVEHLGPEVMAPGSIFGADVDVLFTGSKPGVLDHDNAAAVRAGVIVPIAPVPVTAKGLAVLRRAGAVVLPDFVTISGPFFAMFPQDGAGPEQIAGVVDEQIRSVLTEVLTHEDGPLLGACHRAEAFLRTWQDTLPFGRPLA